MRTCICSTLAVALLATSARSQPIPAGDKPETGDLVGALISAAKDGDNKGMKRLLASGAKVDAKGEGGVTALFVAALHGQAGAAELLIEKGADLKAAKGQDGSTALHAAAFLCHMDTVRLLLKKGADINARNQRSETPLDTVAGAWSEDLGRFYGGLAQAIGLELDVKKVEATRPKIAALLAKKGGKSGKSEAKGTVYRGSYFRNGEIHVNEYGTLDGKPLTSGHQDFKPSWSKTGDMLVFFRRLKNDPVVTNWKTAIHVIHVDGTGLHPLSDGTHTDFNQTWTRDGTNTPIWNRKHPERVSFQVMASKVGNKPGQEVALTDKSYHTWAYTCLIDGRILVQCSHPKHGYGYFLMTPDPGGRPRFERIDCEMAKKGILDRVSISPSETKVCFEFQRGFRYKNTGRTLYIADFDAKTPSITNAKPFANEEGANRWFAYPRWSQDEKAIVYQASPSLYLYTLEDGTTVKVSTKDGADYRYPHMEATPK